MSNELYNHAQQNVLTFVLQRNYNLITDISSIKVNTDKFTYICKCGKERNRSFSDIINNRNKDELLNINYVPKCCIPTIKKDDPTYKWYTDDTIKEYINKDDNEHWIKYQQYWVSNKGKIIGKKGENLVKDGLIKTGKKTFTILNIMTKVFKEKEIRDDNFPYFKDDIIHSDNIYFKENYISTIKKISLDELNSIEHKELKEFPDYKIYKNGIIVRKSYGKIKNDKLPTFEKCNDKLVVKMKDSNRYNIDILMLMAFFPFFEEQEDHYKNYINELDVIHIDGDYSNCCVENLKVKYKDQSKEQQRKIREEQRIKEVHDYINSFIIKVSGKLLTDISDITNIHKEFKYKCKCDTIFNRSVKHLKDNDKSTECNICRKTIINNVNKDENTINIEGIYYKKFEYGWISEKGEFINNNKEMMSIKREGTVKILGKNENAKKLIAKTYKIPHYEFLEKEGYFVKTKDKSNNLSPSNLFVWGNGLKETMNLPLSKQYNDNLLLSDNKQSCYYFNLAEPPLFDYKTSPLFPGIIIYKNGMLKVSEDTYTIGRIRTNGYCDINIKGKNYSIHRIICYLFNPIEDKITLDDYSDFQVNHKDGNKINNNASNLEWVTKSQNIKHAIDSGLTGYTYPVNQYELLPNGEKGKLIKSYPCIKYAINESGQSRTYIINMCKGETKPYKYYWEFVNKEDIEKSKTKKRVKLTVSKSYEILDD